MKRLLKWIRRILRIDRYIRLSDYLERCADCGWLIGNDSGPPDGWQLDVPNEVEISADVFEGFDDTKDQYLTLEDGRLVLKSSDERRTEGQKAMNIVTRMTPQP